MCYTPKNDLILTFKNMIHYTKSLAFSQAFYASSSFITSRGTDQKLEVLKAWE